MNFLFSPYLNFNGNCSQAMKFYQSVLGGDLSMQTFGESNPEYSDGERKDKIIHATLKTSMLEFMASDCMPDRPATIGDSVHLSMAGTDEQLLTKYFNDLAEGGTVDMPLEKQFWGDIFGMLTDKFGMHWMINISSEEK